MSDKPHQGRIEKWYEANGMIFGFIYDDPNRGWRDGDHMRTSSLVTAPPYAQGQVIETRNSRYELGVPAKPLSQLV